MAMASGHTRFSARMPPEPFLRPLDLITSSSGDGCNLPTLMLLSLMVVDASPACWRANMTCASSSRSSWSDTGDGGRCSTKMVEAETEGS